mmetsp:Transcript_35994/g.41553  ORF Transcript_35994/g.41553 Transcript_35994/m.41553 type:complete len:91 (+) Transcript_35994:280-552(+)
MDIGPKQNIDENNPVEVQLQKAMESLYSQVKKKIPQLEKTVNMIETIVKNIVENPEEAKYRSIKTSNEKIHENILKFKAAVEILEFFGFL